MMSARDWEVLKVLFYCGLCDVQAFILLAKKSEAFMLYKYIYKEYGVPTYLTYLHVVEYPVSGVLVQY